MFITCFNIVVIDCIFLPFFPINNESLRIEPDEFMIISGIFEGYTTGKPITIVIPNEDIDDSKYEKLLGIPRPGSADFVNFLDTEGCYDFFGGGHNSGRVTVGIVAAGAIVRAILEEQGVRIFSRITKMGEYTDDSIIKDETDFDKAYVYLRDKALPIYGDNEDEYNENILKIKKEKDSYGGEIETQAWGLPYGLGNAWFDSLQAKISYGIKSIAGVKGIQFGDGFEMARMKGSQANDFVQFIEHDDGKELMLMSNHNGGISGGMSTGKPIVFRTVCKPTPSIGKSQDTINFRTEKNIKLKLEGRFDPTITRKVCAVINNLTAIILADSLAEKFGLITFKKSINEN